MTNTIDEVERRLHAALRATIPRLLSDDQAPNSGADLNATRQETPARQVRAIGGATSTRWWSIAAAVALLAAGAVALVALRRQPGVEIPRSASSTATSASAPNDEQVLPAPIADQVLLLPPAEADVTYVQHDEAPDRSRGLVVTPAGSTMSINVFSNSWGELPDDTDQREINQTVWATTLEDGHRVYVTLDHCTMLSVGAGNGATAWDVSATELLSQIDFDDPIVIDLPVGWALVDFGEVGDWYSMSYNAQLPGTPQVTLTQMPGSTVGPLLADIAGHQITPATIAGHTGWEITLPDDGLHHLIWEAESGAMMLTSSGLTPDQANDVIAALSPATTREWDDRYGDRDQGGILQPTECGPAAVTIRTPPAGTSVPSTSPAPSDVQVADARRRAWSIASSEVLAASGWEETASEVPVDEPFTATVAASPIDASGDLVGTVTIQLTVRLWNPNEYSEDPTWQRTAVGATTDGTLTEHGTLFAETSDQANPRAEAQLVTPLGLITATVKPVPGTNGQTSVDQVVSESDLIQATQSLASRLPNIIEPSSG